MTISIQSLWDALAEPAKRANEMFDNWKAFRIKQGNPLYYK